MERFRLAALAVAAAVALASGHASAATIYHESISGDASASSATAVDLGTLPPGGTFDVLGGMGNGDQADVHKFTTTTGLTLGVPFLNTIWNFGLSITVSHLDSGGNFLRSRSFAGAQDPLFTLAAGTYFLSR